MWLLKQKLKQLAPIAHQLGLTYLDQKQALAFMKEYDIKPSQLAVSLLIMMLLIIFLLDGTGFVVSIISYLIPAYFCLLQFEKKANCNSTISNNHSNIFYRKYFTYWTFYIFLQIVSPVMLWMFSPLTHIFIRIALAFALLYPKVQMALVFYNIVIAKVIGEQIILENNMQEAEKQQHSEPDERNYSYQQANALKIDSKKEL